MEHYLLRQHKSRFRLCVRWCGTRISMPARSPSRSTGLCRSPRRSDMSMVDTLTRYMVGMWSLRNPRMFHRHFVRRPSSYGTDRCCKTQQCSQNCARRPHQLNIAGQWCGTWLLHHQCRFRVRPVHRCCKIVAQFRRTGRYPLGNFRRHLETDSCKTQSDSLHLTSRFDPSNIDLDSCRPHLGMPHHRPVFH